MAAEEGGGLLAAVAAGVAGDGAEEGFGGDVVSAAINLILGIMGSPSPM